MALKFNCGVCGKTIITYLRAGEKAKCAGCGSEAVVPWDATTTNEKPEFAPGLMGSSGAASQETASGGSTPWNAGQKNMLVGALWCIGGIIVTVATYQAAVSRGGGTYFITWGAILFGAIQFFRGLIQASRGETVSTTEKESESVDVVDQTTLQDGTDPSQMEQIAAEPTPAERVDQTRPQGAAYPSQMEQIVTESSPRWIPWSIGIAVGVIILYVVIKVFSGDIPW
ncbi:MAG: hypothetical protein NT002_12135 [candidate division Zixibacteria bacterium]|nr:hypothetical protein [candidate division Zixibacteria bacterium]